MGVFSGEGACFSDMYSVSKGSGSLNGSKGPRWRTEDEEKD